MKNTVKTLLENIETDLAPFEVYGLRYDEVENDARPEHLYQKRYNDAVNLCLPALFDYQQYKDNPYMGLVLLKKLCLDCMEAEKPVAKAAQEWQIEKGQIFYNGKELEFATGQIQEVMVELIKANGKTVTYEDFVKIADKDAIRHHIAKLRKLLKPLNYEVQTVRSEGYCLKKLGS